MVDGDGLSKADAEARTAKANAEVAEIEAKKKKREEEEASTPAARAQREATAQRTEITSLIPDLSKVDRGQLDAGTQPLFGTMLTQAALKDVSRALVKRLMPILLVEEDAKVRLLITSDVALVDSDATYRQVVAGTEWLNQTGGALLESVHPAKVDTTKVFAFSAVLGALAIAVPGVLSLFSAHRKIASGAVDPGDLAAAAAVAGEFRRDRDSWTVVHDDIRLLPAQSNVEAQLRTLNDLRQKLATYKLTADTASAEAAEVGAAIQAIDGFVTSITAVPAGGTRSALMTALLREELHTGSGSSPVYVLVLKSQGGSAQGVTDDKPLWFKDKFSTVAALSLTYFLLSATEPGVVTAGVLTGTATGHGTIGDALKLSVKVSEETL